MATLLLSLTIAAICSYAHCAPPLRTDEKLLPVKFDCPQLPPLSRPARNVYELRPQDIQVVMALGDSITAGEMQANFTMHGWLPTWAMALRTCMLVGRVRSDGLPWYRPPCKPGRVQGIRNAACTMAIESWLYDRSMCSQGESWSIGGNPNASTIATFLRHYNPGLVGASLGSHIVEVYISPLIPQPSPLLSKLYGIHSHIDWQSTLYYLISCKHAVPYV